MRFITLLPVLLLVLLTSPSFAQLTVTTGEEYVTKPSDKEYGAVIVEATTNGYTYMQQDNESLVFRQFDGDHRLLSIGSGSHFVNKFRFAPSYFVQLGKNTFGIESVYNPRNKHWELRAGRLSGTDLREVKALISYPYNDQARTDNVLGGLLTRYNSTSLVALSPDHSRLAFLHNDNYKRGKSEPVKMRSVLFDEDINELSSRTFNLPFSGNEWSVRGMKLAADGTLYVAGDMREVVASGKKKAKKGPWQTMVCIITETEENCFPLPMDGMRIQSRSINITKNGCELIGTYIDNRDKKIIGVYHATINADGAEPAVRKIPLADPDLARSLYKDGNYIKSAYSYGDDIVTNRICISPIDVVLPTSSSGYTTYRSDGFYLIQFNDGAQEAGVSYTKTKARPFSETNIFANPLLVDGRAFVLYSTGRKSHTLGEINADGQVVQPQEVVPPGSVNARLFQRKFKVVDGGVFMLRGFRKHATASYVWF